jgi:ribulose-phosphate 3-epimerase
MPSILSADFANLQTAIDSVPSSDAIHVDVMDNHFVPNLTLGLPVVESIRKITDKILDIHLMIEEPDRWAPGYAEAGAESVTFHIEAAQAPVRLARELRRLGARAAMALKPATPIEPYQELLPELDMVLIMTVEPGFGGQSFLDLCLPKITRTRAMLDKLGGDIWLRSTGEYRRRRLNDARQPASIRSWQAHQYLVPTIRTPSSPSCASSPLPPPDNPPSAITRALRPQLHLRSFLTVCIGCNPCRASATYVNVGCRSEREGKSN